MRGVLGIGLIGVGLLVGFLVLSGRFPSSTPPITQGATPTPSTSNSFLNNGTAHAPGHGATGAGPLGLGSMAYFSDLFASRGAMQ